VVNRKQIRVDCGGRTAKEVLDVLSRELEPGHRVVLKVENLQKTRDSVGRLLRDILTLLESRGIQGLLIDPSGCADLFLQTLGPSSGVKARRSERDEPQVLEILVVEDTPDSLDFLRSLLEAAGHRVTAAETGRRAITEAGRRTFDLILLDLLLPDVDGLQVARALSGSRTPIIAMSAYLERWSEEELRAAGLSTRLKKPCTTAEILSALTGTTKRI
jgi:CheY-like chemotaxis protein